MTVSPPSEPARDPTATAPRIDRRNFLTIVFGTASLAMLRRADAAQLEKLASRPVHAPYRLALEGSYIVDPEFDAGDVELPTRREHHGYDALTREEQICFLAEHGFGDEDDEGEYEWSLADAEAWLDEPVDPEEIGDYAFAANSSWSPYAQGVEIFEKLGRSEAKRLGVRIVEGDHPGSSFVGVAFKGDAQALRALNDELERIGLNLVIDG
jgi:hypothetical protein